MSDAAAAGGLMQPAHTHICNPAHRVSRPRGTGSVGDSVGEGTPSGAQATGGGSKGGGGRKGGGGGGTYPGPGDEIGFELVPLAFFDQPQPVLDPKPPTVAAATPQVHVTTTCTTTTCTTTTWTTTFGTTCTASCRPTWGTRRHMLHAPPDATSGHVPPCPRLHYRLLTLCPAAY